MLKHIFLLLVLGCTVLAANHGRHAHMHGGGASEDTGGNLQCYDCHDITVTADGVAVANPFSSWPAYKTCDGTLETKACGRCYTGVISMDGTLNGTTHKVHRVMKGCWEKFACKNMETLLGMIAEYDGITFGDVDYKYANCDENECNGALSMGGNVFCVLLMALLAWYCN